MNAGRAVITVVSGLPRSGTSLMMQMLEAAGVPILCDDARAADESNPRGYYELAAVRRTPRDPSWVDGAAGHAVKVIHALLPYLPRSRSYRVLFMERDLDEVIDSQDRMLERLGDTSAALARPRLAAVLAAQRDEARALLEAEACFEWLAVSHRELLRRPEQVARELESFLGLRGRGPAMAARVDATLYRERPGGCSSRAS